MTESTSLDVRPARDPLPRRETAKLLLLAVAQIEQALAESGTSVDALTRAVTSLLACEDETPVLAAPRASSRSSREGPRIESEVSGRPVECAQAAIVALQFYDRLSQRLQHVAGGLELLRERLEGEDCRDGDEDWSDLRHAIRASYSMQEERELFDRLVAEPRSYSSRNDGGLSSTDEGFETF